MIENLPPLDIAGRAGRVRDSLGGFDIDALLVTDLVNVRWLTGFTGSAGRCLVTSDRLVLVVDGRYGTQARQQPASHGVHVDVLVGLNGGELYDHLAVSTEGIRTLGIEAEHVTVAEWDRLEARVRVPLQPVGGVVEAQRRLKDDGEIARLERAAAIASEALALVIPMLDHAPTEAEFARALDRTMEDLGASAPSFETIVASGPNAGRPHARPGDRRIEEGDAVIVDYGALVDGYHSDMTRTALLGTVDPWVAEAYAAVEQSQAAGVAAVRAGRTGGEIDAACRDVLAAAGLGEHFTHGTGHGVGLRIHEAPWARAGSADVLMARDVVTVEPGLYRGEVGGVRIEDSVVVTATGCRPLTLTPKDLSCLRSPPTISRPG